MELVDKGKVLLCKEMKLARKRVERFKKEYIFKQDESDRRIDFIEEECSNTKGINTKLKLALPQKAMLEVCWGFYVNEEVSKTDPQTLENYKTKEMRRLIHEVAMVFPRGQGKTTMAGGVGSVGQIADGEYGADVQMLAFNREQAGYLFNACRAMASRKDSLIGMLKDMDMLSSTKQGILYRETNSLMSIKTSDYDSLDGTNAHYNIFDEVHTYEEDFLKVVNDGSSRKRKNWMTWYITTNGTKRDKVFDRYYNQWIDILEDKVANDTVMPFIYKLDDISEVNEPEKWGKAMFMLGITTERETIARDIEMAKNDPVKQSEILAKTFNIPTNNYLSYFTNEECEGNKEQFDNSLFIGNDYRKAKCILGLDLSSVNDICSVSFMIVDGDRRLFKNIKFMPRCVIEERPPSQRKQYESWEVEGHLHIHEKENNDSLYIFDYLKDFMEINYILPVCVGYDNWDAGDIVRYFQNYYGDITKVIPQTVKSLSNPLKIYKSKLKSGNIVFNDPISKWCHGNVNVKVDANQNIFPNKAKAKNKIDVFASQLDAFIAYENNKEELDYYF
jgi:phage terminase large subunit-like protein